MKPPGRGNRMPRLIPAGEVVGRLTASHEFSLRTRPDGRRRACQRFDCACGGEVFALPHTVRSGNTSSCGCLHSERVHQVMVTHGATVDRESAEYRTYRAGLQHRRRARTYATQLAVISPEEFEKILEEAEGKCWICEQIIAPFILHWDHVQPLAKGGAHIVSNLRPACAPCNHRKTDTWPFTDDEKSRIADEVRALRTSLSACSVT